MFLIYKWLLEIERERYFLEFGRPKSIELSNFSQMSRMLNMRDKRLRYYLEYEIISIVKTFFVVVRVAINSKIF